MTRTPYLLVLLAASPALAQSIPISDPGFELPVLAACAFSGTFSPGGWVLEMGNAGTWRPGTCWDILPYQNQQVAYSNGGVIRQDLTTSALPNSIYRLTFAVAARNHTCCTFGTATVQLRANTTVIGSLIITGPAAPTPGHWLMYTLLTTSPPTLPSNPFLNIRVFSSGPQADFDAFALSLGATCGNADFNCDGDIGTDADIASFFSCLSGNCPLLPCINSADFNHDGDTGTDADIESFFRVLARGPC